MKEFFYRSKYRNVTIPRDFITSGHQGNRSNYQEIIQKNISTP